MQMIIHEIRLPLRHSFTTAHGTTNEQQGVIIELSDGGLSGYGEAVCIRREGLGVPDIRAALESARSMIESTRLDDPVEFWAECAQVLGDHRVALSAVDQAAHDLWGKRLGEPVWKLWGLSAEDIPYSDYTIGIDDIDRMVAKVAEFADWPIFKIKLGTERDLDVVRALREHTTAVFRVDANCAWTVDQTLDHARGLADLGVEFIEQPVAPGAGSDQVRLHVESALPLMADESCLGEEDIDACACGFAGVNIKLAKCGGLTPARRMINRARSHGLKVMVGCMTESTVGISAIAQLLPLVDYADIDGAVLVAHDVADGVRLERGRPVLPTVAGTGITWHGSSPQPTGGPRRGVTL